jgi:hypothetical protein
MLLLACPAIVVAVTWALVAVFLVTWLLSTLLMDAYLRRRPSRSLADRLWPYRPTSLAHEWLSGEPE